MQALFVAACLFAGAASAADCDMTLGSTVVDYGSLNRAELATASAPVSLGKRQLALSVICRQPQTFTLQFDAEPAGRYGFKFASGGYYTVELKRASIDGAPVLLSLSTREGQPTAASGNGARLIPNASVSAGGRGGHAVGRILRMQIEIETYVDDATTRVRDATVLKGMGTLRLGSF